MNVKVQENGGGDRTSHEKGYSYVVSFVLVSCAFQERYLYKVLSSFFLLTFFSVFCSFFLFVVWWQMFFTALQCVLSLHCPSILASHAS